MKLLLSLVALATLLAATAASADCPYPSPPAKIPDGNTATLDEMIAVKKQVAEYDQAIGSYLDCIKQEHEAAVAKAGDSLTDKQRQELDHIEAQKHNAAVEQLQGIADRFNEQVRIYKARTAKKD